MYVMPTQIEKSFITKTAICLLIGCFYGFANYLSGKYYLPGCSFAEFRPQVAIPMFVGILYGPWAGFCCGGLGDMLGYAMGGKGLFFAPYWSFANGLMGLIPGLIRYWGDATGHIDSVFWYITCPVARCIQRTIYYFDRG